MKREIRREMRATLAAMTPNVAAAKSLRACEALALQAEYRDARTVMIFLAIQGEIDPAELARAAWREGKTVLVPVTVWEDRSMVAVAIDSLDSGLVVTDQGIREPVGGQAVAVDEIDLIVVPALAFDRQGNRLGRGGGFYDRFLASPGMRARLCGIAFCEQLLDEVPTGVHDCPVDIIVTDTEVLRFPAHRAAEQRAPEPTDCTET